jgi:hypothetical protein
MKNNLAVLLSMATIAFSTSAQASNTHWDWEGDFKRLKNVACYCGAVAKLGCDDCWEISAPVVHSCGDCLVALGEQVKTLAPVPGFMSTGANQPVSAPVLEKPAEEKKED